MSIYISRTDCPDVENIPSGVLAYIIRKHQHQCKRLDSLHEFYMNRNHPPITDTEHGKSIAVPYSRLIVELLKGYYLGEPIKYDGDDDTHDIGSQAVLATVKNGNVVRYNKLKDTIDDTIEPILEAYKNQTISEVDNKLGEHIGIYGEAYELVYVSDDSTPKSTVIDPRCCVMVRDDTVEHRKMFFLTYEYLERISGARYVRATVYTDRTKTVYEAPDLFKGDFIPTGEKMPLFFGEVPVIEYENNNNRIGDFEQEMSLIDAYNNVLSDRVTDKARFIDSVLAVFGADIDDEMKKDLKEWRLLSGLPIESRIEYIQKVFDENSVHILADDISTEIHKQSMTVDFSDVSFGNASGQALKLKLLTMTMLIKNKIRSFEKGLKKRFEIYNKFYNIVSNMPLINKNNITPIFSISIPIDENNIVDMVCKLQDIVDDETLLNLLWFVKDPRKVIEKMKVQRKERQSQYADAFGIRTKFEENTADDDDDDDSEDDYNE